MDKWNDKWEMYWSTIMYIYFFFYKYLCYEIICRICWDKKVNDKEKRKNNNFNADSFNRFVLLRGMNLLELEEDCYFFSFFPISSWIYWKYVWKYHRWYWKICWRAREKEFIHMWPIVCGKIFFIFK